MGMLGYLEQTAWHKTPYQIITLFKYHKEYNPHIFGKEKSVSAGTEEMDDIDIALGGF